MWMNAPDENERRDEQDAPSGSAAVAELRPLLS
jgi:hypothetical protein